MPEDMPDRMPEDLPDRMPDRMPEDMSEHMPEDMPDRMPNRMPEDMSDRMPQDLLVRKCINVMVGITRSKVIFPEIYNPHSQQPKTKKKSLGTWSWRRPAMRISSMRCRPRWTSASCWARSVRWPGRISSGNGLRRRTGDTSGDLWGPLGFPERWGKTMKNQRFTSMHILNITIYALYIYICIYKYKYI